jgi:hypothetical protein
VLSGSTLHIYPFNIEWIAKRSNYLAGNGKLSPESQRELFIQQRSTIGIAFTF